MRFGIFVHWGPGSLTGRELSWARKRGQVPVKEYDNLYRKFNPVRFDAGEWVETVASAGAKYMVFTAKHHDGFVNFDSKHTDYKITARECPFGRDVVGELAGACRRRDVMLGIYYSQRDWHSPHFMTGTHHLLIKQIHAQLKELCTNYGTIGVVWFDAKGPFYSKHWDTPNLFKLIRERQPDVLINDRCGVPGDFTTVEYRVGSFNRKRAWESCIRLGTQWSWKPKDRIKSLEECVHALIRCAGGDGNLLLNVGPMPDGRIEPRQAERLREIGAWLKDYGQAIYGTRGGPFVPGEWGASTCREDRAYLFILKWPKEGWLVLPPIGRRIESVGLLTGGTVTVKQNDMFVAIDVPAADRRGPATIVELDLDGAALDVAPARDLPSGCSYTPAAVRRGLKSNQASRRKSGSASVLRGRVCIYHVFVADGESSWSKDEKAEVQKRMAQSVEFLRKQADRYGVSVSFTRETAPEFKSPKDVSTDAFAKPVWTEEVIRLASGKSGRELVASLKKKHKAGHAVVMLHVNKDGTSYNLSHYANVDPIWFAERSVMFYRYANEHPTAAASYAHEILHNFGAGELYFPFDKDDKRRRLAAGLWPNEIMCVIEYEPDTLSIGPYTAYRIGWLNELKDQYRAFEDPG